MIDLPLHLVVRIVGLLLLKVWTLLTICLGLLDHGLLLCILLLNLIKDFRASFLALHHLSTTKDPMNYNLIFPQKLYARNA